MDFRMIAVTILATGNKFHYFWQCDEKIFFKLLKNQKTNKNIYSRLHVVS